MNNTQTTMSESRGSGPIEIAYSQGHIVSIVRDGPFYLCSKSIQMRRYSSACVPLGVETQVNTFVNDRQDQPDIVMSPLGSFAVVWRSRGNWDDQSEENIQARLYSASGQALGDQFQVNLSTGGGPQDPTISGNPDLKYVVAWKEGEATIKARVFNGPGVVFSDFFESGGLGGWNFASP